MLNFLGAKLLANLAESMVDNVFRDPVNPVVGSVVYCDLAFGFAEHSGIYIGNGEIAHLDGSGRIEIVDPYTFTDRLDGSNSAISIYVSCAGVNPVGAKSVAARARRMVGKKRSYSILFDNCHQFTSGCLTGDFSNADNFLWLLKLSSTNRIKSDSWRCWEKIDGQYMIIT